jgi:hypothetical protein
LTALTYWTWRGERRAVSTLAAIAILSVMCLWSLGEALSPASEAVPRVVQVGGGLIGAAVYGVMTLLICRVR